MLHRAMWQACATQEEIAEAVEVHQDTISEWTKVFTENSGAEESVKWSGFDTPIYNVWKQQAKSNSVNHFGNSEPRWRISPIDIGLIPIKTVDRYLYTACHWRVYNEN